MRVVLDTNVLVSEQLSKTGRPAAVLFLFLHGAFVTLLDSRILAEYRDVVARPHFGFGESGLDPIAFLEAKGEEVEPELYPGPLPDEDDRPFVEVAVSGGADAIVTGNSKDFPEAIGVPVLTPAAFLRLLEEESA